MTSWSAPASRAGPVPASIAATRLSQDQAGARRQGAALPRNPPAPWPRCYPRQPRRHLYLRPRVPGLAELLHQVDVVVAVRRARRAAAIGVAGPGVETRRLEGDGRRRLSAAGQGHGCPGSGLLDQDGTGVEQVEALALRVLLASPAPGGARAGRRARRRPRSCRCPRSRRRAGRAAGRSPASPGTRCGPRQTRPGCRRGRRWRSCRPGPACRPLPGRRPPHGCPRCCPSARTRRGRHLRRTPRSTRSRTPPPSRVSLFSQKLLTLGGSVLAPFSPAWGVRVTPPCNVCRLPWTMS
jgi:hypothetical protein